MWIVSTLVCGPPGTVMAWSLHRTPTVALLGVLASIGGGFGIAVRITEFSEPQPLSSAGRRDIFTRPASPRSSSATSPSRPPSPPYSSTSRRASPYG
ncbi:hypothetical protein B6E66_25450 [Streptomyces maremycinicus]|nr:hypothetical protein B6E66_25450 [Streptomyces sp. B9173]